MKQILFSNDLALIQRWENILNKDNTELIDDIEDLFLFKNQIIIFNSCACGNQCEMLIDSLVANKNKVLILDRVPEFEKAQRWLQKGIKGYGNAIMTKSYLLSAIEAISNDMIWLIPDITTQFVKSFVNHEKPESKGMKLLENLTKKEKDIALLLKDGYTNSDIVFSLNISPNTVKTHVKNIYKKFQVKDRVSFAILFK